jgi:hypothetical protein
MLICAAMTSAASAPITDGHPLDEVHYREYKILLRPERFTSPQSFQDFWKVVRHAAKELGVEASTSPEADDNFIREVLFYDTEHFDLYNHSFILRKRTFYDKGWPRSDHELVLKFRHPDPDVAAAVDVHPTIGGDAKIKFKEELLLLRHQLGGMRSTFSHGVELISPRIVLDRGLEDIAKAFPALRCLEVPPGTRMALVNSVAVEEIETTMGELEFGHGLAAKATLAVWRNRATEESLSGEFAFQCKFHRYKDLHKKARQLSEDFYKRLQSEAREWVMLGTTKTAMVYGLGTAAVTNHE